MKKELNQLLEYVQSKSSEDSKRPLAYPFFRSLFGNKFKVESAAEGADGYVEGKLLVELKTKEEEWLSGLYQGLHYQKLGLSFPNICVVSNQFIGLWKLSNFPKGALDIANAADSQISPSAMGRINANKTRKPLRAKIISSASYLIQQSDFQGLFQKDIEAEIKGFVHVLKHLDDARIQINLKNFVDHINRLKKYFNKPMDAIHCFYAIVGYWSITSTVVKRENSNELQVVEPSRNLISEPINIDYRHQDDFIKFVQSHYIFTNEGSGITYDNYFSRFDEVISKLDPAYAKQHGIFFTDHNLSKFAMWFVHDKFEKHLSDKYIVFDPAGGSGNLITSLDWRGHMKHKIVSELQPDLLKVIERRMRVHEKHTGSYTIIPKTIYNEGLNFLDKSADDYIGELEQVLDEKNVLLDKPIAFLLNPPYKNTDENVVSREQVEAEYCIDDSIQHLTGKDAARERYLAFLAQIINISKNQNEQSSTLNPILMIFTPTSWLIPRPSYISFRNSFDKHFKFINGFLITSNEFFKLHGKWPLAFTIWEYKYNEEGNSNRVKLWDYTYVTHDELAGINWRARLGEIDSAIKKLLRKARTISFARLEENIHHWTAQKMYDFKRSPTKSEIDSRDTYGGLPLADPRRNNIKTYGITNSAYIGFMDNVTPVRIKPKIGDIRFTDNHAENRVWFRLDIDFKGANKSKIFNGPSDNRSYCAYDLESAKSTCTWFAITKAIAGRYPIWANQFDIWKPNISTAEEQYFYSLCFAFVLAENRCVVTKYEADNPVKGAPDVFVDNPLSTNNPASFWNSTLDDFIANKPDTAHKLVKTIKELYNYWDKAYCQHNILTCVGLQDEPYFQYFSYDDFLTPNSGLIQIRKFAEINGKPDILEKFQHISFLAKETREEIYRLLVDEFNYF